MTSTNYGSVASVPVTRKRLTYGTEVEEVLSELGVVVPRVISPVILAGSLRGIAAARGDREMRQPVTFARPEVHATPRGTVVARDQTQVQTSADVAADYSLSIPARLRWTLLSLRTTNPDTVTRNVTMTLERNYAAAGASEDWREYFPFAVLESTSTLARVIWPSSASAFTRPGTWTQVGPLYGGDGAKWRVRVQVAAGTLGGANKTHRLNALVREEPEEDDGNGDAEFSATASGATA